MLKNNTGKLQVLMGRRGRKAVFSNVYVFAGGKVEATDSLPNPASELKNTLLYPGVRVVLRSSSVKLV